MSSIKIFVLLLFFLVSYCVMYLSLCIWRPCGRSSETKTLTSHDAIRSLLHPRGVHIEVLLRRRAHSNIRLIHAFGITNSTFTSSSTVVHRDFLKHTQARLRTIDSPPKWRAIGGVIKDAADLYLPKDLMPHDYSTYMQAVVFVTVLVGFFGDAVYFPEPSDVRFVTEGINQLWTDSKSPIFPPGSPVLARINEHLDKWIPYDPSDPFQNNPLELILPAYETLWRLVAHTFTYIEGNPSYTRPFLEFFNKPTTIQFATPGYSEGPSTEDILQEVLRLHPPTKRIKRRQDDPSSIPAWVRRRLFGAAGFNCESACNTVAADVEALQRSSVWGPSPHEFDAMRHRASTEAQKACFMPFGIGPLKCVASSLAPRLAGMILAGIASQDNIELTRCNNLGNREGWGGWKIRRKI